MKRIMAIFFLSVLTLISFSALPSSLFSFQSETVSLQKVEPFAYFCLRHKGPFTQLPEVIGRLMQESQAQNVFPSGPLMGIYYNTPGEVEAEELEWELGFPVTPHALIQPPLEKKEWNFPQVASCLHKGPYEKTGESITKIMEWLEANGYEPAGPVLERYLDMNPQELRPEDLKTEIWIPCKKKEY